MREMYQDADSCPSPSPSPDACSDNCLLRCDPFYDRFPWFRLVGRSFVYISNLYYGVPLEQTVPIINEKADIVAFLRVAVHPLPNDPSDCANEARDTVCGRPIRQSGSARVDFNDDDVYFRAQLRRLLSNRRLPNAHAVAVTGPSDSESGCFSQSQQADEELPETDLSALNSLSDDLLDPKEIDAHTLVSGTPLQLDSQLRFRISVLQVQGLGPEYTDVFCQFV